VVNSAHNRRATQCRCTSWTEQNAALNVDRILEMTGQLGKQSK